MQIIISRKCAYKIDAKRISGWMKKMGMTSVEIIKLKYGWKVQAFGTTTQLGKFCVIESKEAVRDHYNTYK